MTQQEKIDFTKDSEYIRLFDDDDNSEDISLLEPHEDFIFNKNQNITQHFIDECSKELKKIFPRVKIEHVGSTSIPGLGGKGIIDIAIKIIGKVCKEIK